MNQKARILLVEDDRENSLMLKEALTKWGYNVSEAYSGEEAIQLGKSQTFDIVLSDIRMGKVDGLQVLRMLRAQSPETLVIMMTGFGSVDSAVEAVKAGAFDYISKPFKLDEVQSILDQALEQRAANQRAKGRGPSSPGEGGAEIVGHSRAMAEVYKMIARLADSRTTVLIQGESGTGKELVAHAIHKHGGRSDKPFVAINCAALPETLLESELFGYAQGAHSTATTSKPGVFEQAGGGVLFLDEVGDMSLTLQSKLLRVLEDSEARPLGSTHSIRVDVRVIAATNKSLDKLVSEGRFRADLMYRLKVVTLLLPPLRERKEDIPALVEHFLRKHGNLANRGPVEVSAEFMDCLTQHAWPGNVRELEHVLEGAVILNAKSKLLLEDLPPELRVSPRSTTILSLAETEKRHIAAVLGETRGNVKATAEILGIDRKTLYRKLAEYGIEVIRT